MKNIGIIFGGNSTEHEVSLQSAHAVMTYIDRSKYRPVLIGITRDGRGLYYETSRSYEAALEKIADHTWFTQPCCYPAVVPQSADEKCLWVLRNERVERIHLDGVFPVLHGKNGEDGTVQGLFELAGIPVIGCKTLSSAVCMHKDMAHRLVEHAGILVPKALMLNREEYRTCRERLEEMLAQKQIGFPVFVKPVCAGSSFGITKVEDGSCLSAAIEGAFEHDRQVLIEENVDGFEVGCAVMGNDTLTVGAVDEIELSRGFFNYEEKYTLKTSNIYVPARISPEKAAQIKETAKKIYRILGCTDFARVDMFLTNDGRIYFNEVNTIPGFTPHSRFPGMMKCAGISFEEIIERLIAMEVVL